MARTSLHRMLALGAAIAACPAALPQAGNAQGQMGAVPVRLQRDAEGWHLTRGGKPFLIKGAGGSGSLKALAATGANSVRTWGADNLGPILDDAQANGLTVTVGIWLGHERHGFDYANADQVADQYAKVRETILKYRDHPAVLMWGLGNEMEGYGKGDNAAIWSAVNNLAVLVHKLDPNHPAMTVVAEIGGDRVKNIHRLCPDIDVVGINSYGGLMSLADRYKQAAGPGVKPDELKPFVATEFGPPGVWESAKNPWGVAAEMTSTEKAQVYRRNWEQGIAAKRGLCLGGYAFTWGQKQEATATWFGLLLPDGTRLGAVDALTEAWSGKAPANRCPEIASLKVEGADQVDPGTTVRATLAASDPEGDALTVRWELRGEPAAATVGGDAQEAPPAFPEAILKSDPRAVELRMPKGGGGYRLYATVTDGHGGAAVANVPLLVKGPILIPEARPAKLPMVVYDEAETPGLPYVPTGWMGNTKAIKLDPKCAVKPHSGKTCLRVDYTATDNWGGVVWQSPEGDWGDRPGGWNLTGASKLTFWARGEAGGEVVAFQYGLLGPEKKFPDSGHGKLPDVKLGTEWQQYTIDLKGQDLKRIKTGFVWTLAASGKPVTFYLDDVRYE